jgi:hypothetical protein
MVELFSNGLIENLGCSMGGNWRWNGKQELTAVMSAGEQMMG